MLRRAFTMRLKPGQLTDYKREHDNIWPELVKEIERSGIASITTFERDPDLFLVSEIYDEAAWDKLWNSPIHQEWAKVMEPFMHLKPDGIVDFGELREIFHLRTPLKGSSVETGRAQRRRKRIAGKKTAASSRGSAKSSAGRPASRRNTRSKGRR